ncbi:sodium/potassium/calcium exchanger 5-like [Lineus longissimus]|uniref:sodium/potassium/calcium exchanger 5-like n=1 Tax=Lineus longissimus TaxID=88925 RepID=UPI002B4D5E23
MQIEDIDDHTKAMRNAIGSDCPQGGMNFQKSGYKKPKWKGRRKATIVRVGIFFLAYIFIFVGVTYFSGTDTGKTTYTFLKDTSSRVKRSLGYQSYSQTNVTFVTRVNSRHLLELNCTPRAIDEFPGDFFSDEIKNQGGIVVHFLISFYLFGALAIVCDDFFVPSLEQISDKLGLQPDVAGATFMAAGSSAPELFTSIIGVFISKNDVGLSTIVGSAIFNILCIISICGLFAGMVIHLTWWPLFRDTSFYALSVCALIIVINDGLVYWYEGMIFILMYIIYILLMYFNRGLEAYFVAKVAGWRRHKAPSVREENAETQALLNSKESLSTDSMKYGEAECSFGGGSTKESGTEDNIEEFESPLTFPDTWFKRITWIIMLPMNLAFVATIPDCRRPGCWQKLFPFTFTLSIAWIAVCSYIMVWMVTIIGDTLGIPDTVMGLTLLAAGTSVPDALAGIFVARDGYGDMAVSNAVGSNVFDILVCLGLPWLLKTTAVNYGSVVDINSSGLVYTAIMLLSTVVILFGMMLIVGWKLNKKIGIFFFLIYVIVTVFACLYELNIFGEFNPPSCPKI